MGQRERSCHRGQSTSRKVPAFPRVGTPRRPDRPKTSVCTPIRAPRSRKVQLQKQSRHFGCHLAPSGRKKSPAYEKCAAKARPTLPRMTPSLCLGPLRVERDLPAQAQRVLMEVIGARGADVQVLDGDERLGHDVLLGGLLGEEVHPKDVGHLVEVLGQGLPLPFGGAVGFDVIFDGVVRNRRLMPWRGVLRETVAGERCRSKTFCHMLECMVGTIADWILRGWGRPRHVMFWLGRPSESRSSFLSGAESGFCEPTVGEIGPICLLFTPRRVAMDAL
jgi:hypothetical protein